MKRLWTILVLVMLFTLPLQAQEYFSTSYNTIVTEDKREIDVDVFVEFNVYGTTDIVIHADSLQPSRFVQVTDVEEFETFNAIRMKLSNKDEFYDFYLHKSGMLVLHNLVEDVSFVLTRK